MKITINKTIDCIFIQDVAEKRVYCANIFGFQNMKWTAVLLTYLMYTV